MRIVVHWLFSGIGPSMYTQASPNNGGKLTRIKDEKQFLKEQRPKFVKNLLI